MALSEKQARKVMKVSRSIQPMLHGLGPEVQGGVLADLTAMWVAGHNPKLRSEVLAMYLMAVRDLIQPSEEQIFGPAGFPTAGLS